MEISAESAFLAHRWAAFLRVTGEDAPTFLQGQFSQDLRNLTIGGDPAYGLMLNHKGRIQADAFILRTSDGYRLASYECSGESLRSRLESYIIADDVTVEDLTADYAGLAILSETRPAAPEGGFVFPGRRALTPNWEIVHSVKQTSEVERSEAEQSEVERVVPNALDLGSLGSRSEPSALGTTRSTVQPPEWWEALRIRSLIPAVPRDAGPGDLPQEAGLTTAAVAFEKGCYLGQEIMARLKSRGRIRRGLRIMGGARPPGALAEPASSNNASGVPNAPGGRVPPLFYQGKPVGELRSWVVEESGSWIGLAMVLVDVPADAELTFA